MYLIVKHFKKPVTIDVYSIHKNLFFSYTHLCFVTKNNQENVFILARWEHLLMNIYSLLINEYFVHTNKLCTKTEFVITFLILAHYVPILWYHVSGTSNTIGISGVIEFFNGMIFNYKLRNINLYILFDLYNLYKLCVKCFKQLNGKKHFKYNDIYHLFFRILGFIYLYDSNIVISFFIFMII